VATIKIGPHLRMAKPVRSTGNRCGGAYVEPGSGRSLRGRASECETLRGLISTADQVAARCWCSAAKAGVGKTALLEYLTELASDSAVSVAGVQSDMELAFAGLQQLCAPLMDHLDELPEPQREALAVAFGRGVGPTPGPLPRRSGSAEPDGGRR